MRGALLIVERADGPVYFGKWRDSTRRQVKRRLGPAWVFCAIRAAGALVGVVRSTAHSTSAQRS
jgi:hypothetical protein